MLEPGQRFSNRVDNYSRYRPGYPNELVDSMLAKAELAQSARIADIGSGTGIFTAKLLQRGLNVSAVEPNTNMRLAAESELAAYDNFTSIDGRAEQTGLESGSIDLITAAQAFHWFNNQASQTEFRRILKPEALLALVWNKRRLEHPFQKAYDAILREFAPEYDKVSHMRLDAAQLADFFVPGEMSIDHFDNRQQLSFADLIGRLQSSSYCPDPKSPQYIPLATELLGLFDQYAMDGQISFEYDSQLYMGPIA